MSNRIPILSAARGTAGTAAGTAWGPGMTTGTLYETHNPHGTTNIGENRSKAVILDNLGTTDQVNGTVYGRSAYPATEPGNWALITQTGWVGSGQAAYKEFEGRFNEFQVRVVADGSGAVPFKVTLSSWPE